MRFLANLAVVLVPLLTDRDAVLLVMRPSFGSSGKRHRCSFPAGFAAGLIIWLSGRVAIFCKSLSLPPALSGKGAVFG